MPVETDERAVRDAVAEVFRSPEYATRSVLDRLQDAIFGSLGRALRWLIERWGDATSVPGLAELVGAFILIVVVAAVVRVLLGREARRLARRGAGGRDGRGFAWHEEHDPWAVAQREASAGRFTEAAHALYQALLLAAARREEVKLHPSKTAGDYARELRSRSSTLFAGFRDFARLYELVVYGIGTCDRERYERLRVLAVRMSGENG